CPRNQISPSDKTNKKPPQKGGFLRSRTHRSMHREGKQDGKHGRSSRAHISYLEMPLYVLKVHKTPFKAIQIMAEAK
ncbi:hypothetical protein, partial [Komagataeibacter sp. NFXK3]